MILTQVENFGSKIHKKTSILGNISFYRNPYDLIHRYIVFLRSFCDDP